MESKIHFEDLLGMLGRSTAEGGDTGATHLLPPEEVLLDYREGRLSSRESADLERLLARSVLARERLSDLVPTATDQPSPELREKVLAAFDSRFSACRGDRRETGYSTIERRRSRRRPQIWGLIAAAVVATAGALLLFRPQVPLPDDLHYTILIQGLAQERGRGAVAELDSDVDYQQILAYADTRVRVTASPAGEAFDDVDFGFYQLHSGEVKRFDVEAGITLEKVRGAARLSVRAGDLVEASNAELVAPGFSSSEVLVYLVVAREGDLPPIVAIRDDQSAIGTLEDAGRRRVYPFAVRVLDPEVSPGKD